MAPIWSVIADRKDKANQPFWTEYRVPMVSGCCPAEPGAIVLLGPDCKIDPCLLPPSTGVVIEINGVPSPCQDILNFISGTGINITYSPDCGYIFDATGIVACGSAAYLCTDEVGTKVEVDLSHPTHPGQLLISQPGNNTALWADPQVQGLYPAGSTICPAPTYVAPTCIQPILIGAEDENGYLQNLTVSPFGSPTEFALNVNVVNPLTVEFPPEICVSQCTTPWEVTEIGPADTINAANSTTTPLAASATISGIQISGGLLTVTVGSYLVTSNQVPFGPGAQVYLSGLSFAAFLTGSTVTVLTTTNNSFTALPPAGAPAFYEQTYDTGSAATSTAMFIGTPLDLTAVGFPVTKLTLQATSDVDSAFNGYQIQYSPDGINWDHVQQTTLIGTNDPGDTANMQGGVYAKWARVLYVNGPVAQTYFRLQTLISPQAPSPTIKNLEIGTQSDDCAIVTRSVLTGKTVSGSGRYTDVITDVYGSLQTVVGGQAADAFGRLRIATPISLFDAQFQYDQRPLLFQVETTGGGSVFKTPNESSVTLSTGDGNVGSSAVNQTKAYLRYEPGKSQQIIITGVLGAPSSSMALPVFPFQQEGTRSRMGYFDTNDGVFFELDGTLGASTNVRSSTSGSPVDTKILQAEWNFDKMDGSGPSQIVLDWTKTQIFVIDMQWLGVGRVRFGFFHQGVLIICHQVYNSNIVVNPYMNTANLPVRAEITNTGVGSPPVMPSSPPSGERTMKQICMAVISEGGVDNPQATQFSAANGSTGVFAASGTRTPLVSIQPKLTFGTPIALTNRIKIDLSNIQVLTTGGNSCYWELIYNGTLGGPTSFQSVDTLSAINYDRGASSCIGGTVVASGYASGGAGGSSKVSVAQQIASRYPLTLDITGTIPDTFTLCASGIGGAVTVYGEIDWQEVH
jgi:hypothetical protein